MMMKLKEYLVSCGLLASAVFLGGCGATFVNLTAVNQSQNPPLRQGAKTPTLGV